MAESKDPVAGNGAHLPEHAGTLRSASERAGKRFRIEEFEENAGKKLIIIRWRIMDQADSELIGEAFTRDSAIRMFNACERVAAKIEYEVARGINAQRDPDVKAVLHVEGEAIEFKEIPHDDPQS